MAQQHHNQDYRPPVPPHRSIGVIANGNKVSSIEMLREENE